MSGSKSFSSNKFMVGFMKKNNPLRQFKSSDVTHVNLKAKHRLNQS